MMISVINLDLQIMLVAKHAALMGWLLFDNWMHGMLP